MAQAGMAALASTNTPHLPARTAKWVRDFARQLSDPYRPELHYMRGPGPKWREKHGQSSAPDAHDFGSQGTCEAGA